MALSWNNKTLSWMLYSIPRMVNLENVSLLNQDLMKAFLWHGSDTLDSHNRYLNIEYGLVKHRSTERKLYFGLKLRDYDVLLSDIIEDLSRVAKPDNVDLYNHPKITQEEWEQTTKITAMVLRSTEAEISGNHNPRTENMRVLERGLSYHLFTASRLLDETTTIQGIREGFVMPTGFSELLDYGIIEDRIYGDREQDRACLHIKDKGIPISELILSLSDFPSELKDKYPYLDEQHRMSDLPEWFKKDHMPPEKSIEEWETIAGSFYPKLWFVIPFTAYSVLSSFEAYVDKS
ncbi:MAG: hypothetical protein RLP44_11355 [Aggregatilineales bacterium]